MFCSFDQFSEIFATCQRSKVGKLLPDALYVHVWALHWKAISDRNGWLKCLEEHCAELRGHRVVWRKDADPYRVKLVQAARRQRAGKV